jgi:biopolymer transport protein ExbB
MNVSMVNLLAFSMNEAVAASWSFLLKGGIFMIPLTLTLMVGVTTIIYKFLSLSRNRVVPDSLARQVECFEDLSGTAEEKVLLKVFERGETPLARLAGVAIRHRNKPQADIVRAVEASAREEASRLHAGIGVLDIVITVAPLLGLLGTASGLVTIFQGLGESADHIIVSHGIAEALNTTIFGLTIAVPCVIAHGFFTRKIEVFTGRLESLLADLANACQQSGKPD